MARTKETKPTADESHNAICEVKRTYKNRDTVTAESSESDTIKVLSFVTQPAEVGVTLGMTINLGNFDSARIDVSCKVPTYREEIEEAYDFCMNFAEQKIIHESNKINSHRTKSVTKDSNPL